MALLFHMFLSLYIRTRFQDLQTVDCSITCNTFGTRGSKDNNFNEFYWLWNKTNFVLDINYFQWNSRTQTILLICCFTANTAVQNLRLEWLVGDLSIWFLSQANEECLQLAFSLENCMYMCQDQIIIHYQKWRNIACWQQYSF